MDARALGRLTVLDPTGAEVKLGSLWEDRPAVIVWLRHFGCTYCIEQAREFRAAKQRFDDAGARLVFIGNGGIGHLAKFKAAEAPEMTVLTDPAVRTYKAIGAKSGVLRTLGPQTWGNGIRAFRSGARQGAVQGRPFQQGGVLVMLPRDRIAFTHLSSSAGDHPPLDQVLAALPGSRAAAAAS